MELSGMVSLLEVWLNNKKIGGGFLIHHDDHTHGPYLNDGRGNPLPTGWYDLRCVTNRDVVWPPFGNPVS